MLASVFVFTILYKCGSLHQDQESKLKISTSAEVQCATRLYFSIFYFRWRIINFNPERVTRML